MYVVSDKLMIKKNHMCYVIPYNTTYKSLKTLNHKIQFTLYDSVRTIYV